MMMTGLEPGSSDVRRDRSVNCATGPAHDHAHQLLIYVWLSLNQPTTIIRINILYHHLGIAHPIASDGTWCNGYNTYWYNTYRYNTYGWDAYSYIAPFRNISARLYDKLHCTIDSSAFEHLNKLRLRRHLMELGNSDVLKATVKSQFCLVKAVHSIPLT